MLRGLGRRKWTQAIIGICLAVFTGAFFWFLSFWGEALWFEAVGYSERFWKVVITKVLLSVAGAVFGLAVISVLTWRIPRDRWIVKGIAKIIGVYIGCQWAIANWDKILLYLNSVSTDVTDPILGRNTGFYLFKLPLYNSAYGLLLALAVISIIASFVGALLKFRGGAIELQEPGRKSSSKSDKYGPIYLSSGFLLLVLAWGKYLDRFGLMYSSLGAVTGPGWTDANVRLPVYAVSIVLTVLAALVVAVPYLRNKLMKLFSGFELSGGYEQLLPLITAAVFVVGVWFVLLAIVPGLFQWLKVQPNEITLEQPYIKHNIDFTRRGFGLHRIEDRKFPVSEEFTRQMIEQNQNLFGNIRLWDWRALDSVYKQFQEIRLYYEFSDVDVDRYTIQDTYRQVMVSAREIQLENLPAQSQTFVNRRFKYTHGNGITLTRVSEFTPEGLPNLLIKDIPPKSEYPELEIDQPRIYYGELTDTHVVVNTEEKELDYPSGEENVYIRYNGNGGVQISNLWRKFLFGWKFDGTRFLLSGYPTSESRIMFYRKISERVKTIAPFLKFDDDPYIVLAKGRLYWIIDAYTVSTDYPYSEPTVAQSRIGAFNRRFQFTSAQDRGDLSGINYIRNSIKAVVDAFNGSVSFYVFEEEDPLINAWKKVFPELFKNRDEMPAEILNHIRYPADMLLIQGLVYSKYHMTDPTVFYNQEDLWVRATEKYYDQTQPVQPYYIMWEMPGSDELQFVLMLPFTPKNKQVLIAWIAGMCDPENYGRLLAYKFPKEKRVLGTQQVETKIDQDRVLSGQLSLWDQRGSRVIRGNVLAIPVEDTLLYVEPIYLQAETAAYPELRLVTVMHDDNLSYAETFDEALYGLVEKEKPELEFEEGIAREKSVQELIEQANDAFENYLNALGQKEFDGASNHLNTLSDSLQRLMNIKGENGSEE
jgi:hypothetical protein